MKHASPPRWHLAATALAIVLVFTVPAAAQNRGVRAAAVEPPAGNLPAPSVTHHVLQLGDRTLRFTATAGSVTVPDPEGDKPAAEIATIAYTLDGADPRTRPALFAVNGGPGFASAWLQLGAVGPWRIGMGGPDDALGGLPSSPPTLTPNDETWLDFADLVFLDPAGTGYSRFLDADEGVHRHFWGIQGDIQSLAETVRRWLEANGRVASPKFLLGESYGGFRVPRLAWTLQSQQGIGVAGLLMVSPLLDFGGRSSAFDPLSWAEGLPTKVAVARAIKQRSGAPLREQDLADVEQYALGDFLHDELLGDADQAAVQRIGQRVAALTGLDPALVARDRGRVPTSVFLREIDPGHIASPYDGTETAPDAFPVDAGAREADPVLDRLYAPFSSAMLELYVRELNWRPETPYRLLNRQVGRQWEWGRGLGAPESITALRALLAADPRLHVLVGAGLFDLVVPYFSTKLLLQHLPPIGPPDRVRFVTYAGGHMFYARDAARAAFRSEAAALIGAPPPEP